MQNKKKRNVKSKKRIRKAEQKKIGNPRGQSKKRIRKAVENAKECKKKSRLSKQQIKQKAEKQKK